MTAGVYQIFNKVTSDRYIDGSVNANEALEWYVKNFSENNELAYLPNYDILPYKIMLRDWGLYGKDSFSWGILERTFRDKVEIKNKRVFWCRRLLPSYNCNSYNPIVSGIYRILNVKTKEVYVGQSVDIYHRWDMHKSSLNTGKHFSKPLQQSWNQHGTSNFSFEIMETCLPEKTILTLLERSWIARTPKVFNVMR